MPKLDFAFLADAAEAEGPGRKLYVLGGGIDSIGSQTFPVVHPHLSIVMRLLVHPTETDRQHRLEIRLIDSDGGELARIDGNFTAHSGQGPIGRDIPLPLVINMTNTRFERAGDYSLELLINDQHAKSLPLRLQEVTGPPKSHPG